MYILKIKTALNAEKKTTHPSWEEAMQEGMRAIQILFPQSERSVLLNVLDKSGEIHGGGIRIEVYDEKMEAWH